MKTLMSLNPLRVWRRQRRLVREAAEEAQFLRRRHGADALTAAREKLQRPDVTSWGRAVLRQTIRVLDRRP